MSAGQKPYDILKCGKLGKTEKLPILLILSNERDLLLKELKDIPDSQEGDG